MKRIIKHCNKSWKKASNYVKIEENELLTKWENNKKKCAAYLIIELYMKFDEIFFLDEFYLWNNKKNGTNYSWFERGSKWPYYETYGEY